MAMMAPSDKLDIIYNGDCAKTILDKFGTYWFCSCREEYLSMIFFTEHAVFQ
jgi:hypothetical protein